MGIKVNPADYECYFGLGEVYRAMEKYNEAIKWYKESERLSSSVNYSCPYQGLGNVYKRIGKPSQAESSYLSAIKESANFYRGYYLIADYYYQVGELTKADININKALGLCKEEQKRKVLVLKGMILISQQKYSEAEKLFTGMRKEYGDGYDILTGLGHICNARKEYGKAMEYFQKAVGSKEKGWRIGTYLGMAWVRANEGRHKEAIELYKEVLKSEPLNILALLGMGNAYNWLGDYSEAERYFQKVLDIDKDNEYALAELGTVYLNKGDSRRSEQLFSQSIRINNTNYTCPYEGLGLLYLKQGDTKKAEESFLKAIRINPDIEFRKFNGLAKIYIKQGKLKEAKELLEKSIANYPYDNEARQLLKELESGNRKL
jgi:tetratricopeptide (TPR) repeat protein